MTVGSVLGVVVGCRVGTKLGVAVGITVEFNEGVGDGFSFFVKPSMVIGQEDNYCRVTRKLRGY